MAVKVSKVNSGRAAASRRAASGARGARERSVAFFDRPRRERRLPPGDVTWRPTGGAREAAAARHAAALVASRESRMRGCAEAEQEPCLGAWRCVRVRRACRVE